MRNIKYRTPIYVEWIDSTSRTGWHQEVDAEASLRVKSVGWFLKATKDRIVIAKSLAVDNNDEIETQHSQMHIPRVAITKIRALK